MVMQDVPSLEELLRALDEADAKEVEGPEGPEVPEGPGGQAGGIDRAIASRVDVDSADAFFCHIDSCNCSSLQSMLVNRQPTFEGTQLLAATDSDGNTGLHRCISQSSNAVLQSMPVVQLLLFSRADVNASNLLGESPLMVAVQSGASNQMLRPLLEAKADTNSSDSLGETALMEAACLGSLDVCSLLLEFRASASKQNLRGLSSLDLAEASGAPAAVLEALKGANGIPPPSTLEDPKRLPKSSASVPDEAELRELRAELRIAVKSSCLAEVQLVLAKLDAASETALMEALSVTDGSGRSLLHLCVSSPGDDAASIAMALVAHMSELVDAEDAFGRTPLQVAVEMAFKEQSDAGAVLAVVKALLDFSRTSQKVEIPDETHTDLSREVFELLRSASVELRSRGQGRWTEAQHCAAGSQLDDERASSEPSAPATPSQAGQPGQPGQPAQPGQAGLPGFRRRCELHGIPADIGSFRATQLLQECEKLSQLSLEELSEQWRADGFTLHPTTAQEMCLRLKQLAIWRSLDLPELRSQCRNLQSIDASSLSRDACMDAMVFATWRISREHLVPANHLGPSGGPSGGSVSQFEGESLEKLKERCLKHGFAPPIGPLNEVLQSLSKILAWEAMPLASLRDACKAQGLAVRGDHRKPELLQALKEASWVQRGVPLRRLLSKAEALELLCQIEALEKQSIAELRLESRRRDLPEAFGKEELLHLLTRTLVWERLPLEELEVECDESCGLVPARLADDLELQRKELIRRLTKAQLLKSWRDQRMDSRVTNPAVVELLFRQLGRLRDMSVPALRAEHRKHGQPPEPNLAKEDLVGRLITCHVMQTLPLPELRKECQKYDASFTGLRSRVESEQRRELCERIFAAICRQAWEALGIPVRRFGSVAVAAKVVENIERFSSISDCELRLEHRALGFAREASVGSASREEMKKRLKQVAIWNELPIKELQKECRDCDISTAIQNGSRISDADHRRELVDRLIVGLALQPLVSQGFPVQRIESVEGAHRLVQRLMAIQMMSEDDLRTQYSSLGLAPEALGFPSKPELLRKLKAVERFRELPFRELQRECKLADVSIGGCTKEEKEQQEDLLERLILVTCADGWSASGVPVKRLGIQAASRLAKELQRLEALPLANLQKEFISLDLPLDSTTSLGPQALRARLRLVATWKELPPHELRRECQDRSVSTAGSTSLSEASGRQEVLERLILVVCADAWAARGIPLKRLADIQSAKSLVASLQHLSGLTDAALKEEYLKLKLPDKAGGPVPRKELLERLQRVALWKVLPLHELRKDCQELRNAAAGDNRKELEERLLASLASWERTAGPSERASGYSRTFDGGSSGSSWQDVRFKAPMPSMAEHFSILRLTCSASFDEVRKSYRKLALQYHPDKNLEAQEDAAQQFRRVTDSYKALCDFFEKKGGKAASKP